MDWHQVMFSGLKYILWDFDGVIIDSNKIREFGFTEVLKGFPKKQINELLLFHKKNGGLSRYVKFRYFYEIIRKEKVTNDLIKFHADKFSKIMHIHLPNKNLLIKDSIGFIEKNHKKFEMHIVSGSDQNELRDLCSSLEISNFFSSISGSPTPKNNLVENLISNERIIQNEACLIGDSINDHEAAKVNGITFYGYNNSALKNLNCEYISTFSD